MIHICIGRRGFPLVSVGQSCIFSQRQAVVLHKCFLGGPGLRQQWTTWFHVKRGDQPSVPCLALPIPVVLPEQFNGPLAGRTTWRSWFIADEEPILRLWKHIPQPLGGDVCPRRGTYGAEQLDVLLDDVAPGVALQEASVVKSPVSHVIYFSFIDVGEVGQNESDLCQFPDGRVASDLP